MARAPTVILCIIGAVVGYAGWGHGLTPVAALLPLVWVACTTRAAAFAATTLYYLAGSRSMPYAADVFFARDTALIEGIVIWLGAAFLLALPWAALHPGRKTSLVAWRIVAIYLVLLLPPYTYIAWMHPLLGAGLFFPGWGAGGLIVATALTALAVQMLQKRTHRAPPVISILALLAGIYGANMPPPATDSTWAGVNTSDGREPRGLMEEVVRYSKVEEQVLATMKSAPDARYIVLPEGYVGTWNTNARRALKSLLDKPLAQRGAHALVGTAVPIAGGLLATNSLMIYDGTTWSRYDARFAVPVGMWHPWTGDGTEPTFAAFGTIQIGPQRALVSLCFEDLLLGLQLPSLVLQRPDIIVSAANGWWVRKSSAQVIQREHIEAMARIFAVPLVRAVNTH